MSDIINFNVQTKVLPTKGNLVYEYNPFRNYRLTQIKYEYQEQLYTEQELEDTFDIIIDKTYKVVPNAKLGEDGTKGPVDNTNNPEIDLSIVAFKDGSYAQHFQIIGIGPDSKDVTDEYGKYLHNKTTAVAWKIQYNNQFYLVDDFLRNINYIFPWTGGTK